MGDGTTVGQYSIVSPGATVGRDCTIGAHCTIESEVTIGDRVTAKDGSYLAKDTIIENDVYIGVGVVFAGRGGNSASQAVVESVETKVQRNAFIGARSTICSGITIGQSAVVEAGSVVVRSVPPYAVVMGNPAQIVRYTQTESQQSHAIPEVRSLLAPQSRPAVISVQVDGATIHYLPEVRDMRGDLSVGEFLRDVPFLPKRYFLVYGVPSKEARGEHAHRKCHQFLLCLHGSCSIVLDDTRHRMEVPLDSLSKGIYMPPMIWGIQYKFTSDAVLLVFASEHYEPGDYIRSYDEFLEERVKFEDGQASRK